MNLLVWPISESDPVAITVLANVCLLNSGEIVNVALLCLQCTAVLSAQGGEACSSHGPQASKNNLLRREGALQKLRYELTRPCMVTSPSCQWHLCSCWERRRMTSATSTPGHNNTNLKLFNNYWLIEDRHPKFTMQVLDVNHCEMATSLCLLMQQLCFSLVSEFNLVIYIFVIFA